MFKFLPYPRTALLCIGLVCAAGNGMAQESTGYSVTELPDPLMIYPLKSRGLDVQDAVSLFAKNLRVGIVIDEEITGSISGELPQDLSRVEYIDELAALYDFVWYFDGQVLRVSPIGDIDVDVIPLRDTSGATLIETLKRLGLYQDKFIHRADTRSRVLMVSGPTSYTEMVRKVALAIEEAERTDITLMRGAETAQSTALGALNDINNAVPSTPVLGTPE